MFKTPKTTEHTQYLIIPPVFDAFSKDTAVKEALGSRRTRQRQETLGITSTNYKKGVSGYKITPSAIEDAVLGVLAPAVVPEFIGQKFINTAAGKVYVATGTASSADFKILN